MAWYTQEQESHDCPVSDSESSHMLHKCLTWRELQAEADLYSIGTLRSLRTLASQKHTTLVLEMHAIH